MHTYILLELGEKCNTEYSIDNNSPENYTINEKIRLQSCLNTIYFIVPIVKVINNQNYNNT